MGTLDVRLLATLEELRVLAWQTAEGPGGHAIGQYSRSDQKYRLCKST